jgi:hypothetical protein
MKKLLLIFLCLPLLFRSFSIQTEKDKIINQMVNESKNILPYNVGYGIEWIDVINEKNTNIIYIYQASNQEGFLSIFSKDKEEILTSWGKPTYDFFWNENTSSVDSSIYLGSPDERIIWQKLYKNRQLIIENNIILKYKYFYPDIYGEEPFKEIIVKPIDLNF